MIQLIIKWGEVNHESIVEFLEAKCKTVGNLLLNGLSDLASIVRNYGRSWSKTYQNINLARPKIAKPVATVQAICLFTADEIALLTSLRLGFFDNFSSISICF